MVVSSALAVLTELVASQRIRVETRGGRLLEWLRRPVNGPMNGNISRGKLSTTRQKRSTVVQPRLEISGGEGWWRRKKGGKKTLVVYNCPLSSVAALIKRILNIRAVYTQSKLCICIYEVQGAVNLYTPFLFSYNTVQQRHISRINVYVPSVPDDWSKTKRQRERSSRLVYSVFPIARYLLLYISVGFRYNLVVGRQQTGLFT